MCALVGIVGVKLGEWDSCMVVGRSTSWYLAKVLGSCDLGRVAGIQVVEAVLWKR
jgi:hypothetical protein